MGACKICGRKYEEWYCGPIDNGLCWECDEAKWKEWGEAEKNNLLAINRLMDAGHTHHCACRVIWGDGECECGLLDNF